MSVNTETGSAQGQTTVPGNTLAPSQDDDVSKNEME